MFRRNFFSFSSYDWNKGWYYVSQNENLGSSPVSWGNWPYHILFNWWLAGQVSNRYCSCGCQHTSYSTELGGLAMRVYIIKAPTVLSFVIRKIFRNR